MKIQESCAKPCVPTFADLPCGTVYKSLEGRIQMKVKAGGSSATTYAIDPASGTFLIGPPSMVVAEIYPDATLVLKP